MKFSLNPKPVDFNAMAKAIANVSQPPEASQTPIHDGVFPLNDRLQPVKVVINGETNRSRGLNVGQVAKQIFTTTEAAEKAHKINDAQVNLTHVVNGLEEIKKGVQDEQSAKQRQTQSPLKKFIFRHFDHSQKTISHIEKTIVIVKKSALEKDIDLLKASTIETEKLLKKNVELLTKTSSQLSQHLSGSQPIQKNIEDKTKELQRLLNVEATDSESMLPGINRLITDVSNKEVHMNKSKETELKEKKLSDHAENYLVWITLGNLLRTTHLQRQTLQKAKTNYTKACRAFNEAKKQYDDAFATGEKAKELRIQLSTLQAQLKTELDRNRPIQALLEAELVQLREINQTLTAKLNTVEGKIASKEQELLGLYGLTPKRTEFLQLLEETGFPSEAVKDRIRAEIKKELKSEKGVSGENLENMVATGQTMTNLFSLVFFLEKQLADRQGKSDSEIQKFTSIYLDLTRSLPCAFEAFCNHHEELAATREISILAADQQNQNHAFYLKLRELKSKNLLTKVEHELNTMKPGERFFLPFFLPMGTANHTELLCFVKGKDEKVTVTIYKTPKNSKKLKSAIATLFSVLSPQSRPPVKVSYRSFSLGRFQEKLPDILNHHLAEEKTKDVDPEEEIGVGNPNSDQL